MKTAGGVNYDHLSLPVLSCLNGIIDHCPRVSARLMSHNLHANPLTPSLKLVNSRSPEGISGRQNNFVTLILEVVREFGNARRLSGTVHSDHKTGVKANGIRNGHSSGFNRQQSTLPLLKSI